MKAEIYKRVVFFLLILVILIPSACGTLQVESEPAVALIEPAATITEMPLPTPVQVTEEAQATEPSVKATNTPVEVEATAELLTYTNPEYGFTLNYPPTWTVAEVNDEAFVAPGSRSVQLSQGTVMLVIGYRRSGEETMVMGSGAPAGEFEVRGSTHFIDKDVERHVLVFEGKDKAVFYGQPGAIIAAGGLEFAPRLDAFAQVDYQDIELSQSVQDEADMILSSLVIIEVGGEN